MGDRKPTRVIEGGGIRTERWPGLEGSGPSIVIRHHGVATEALDDGEADELIRQLAYIRGWQVTRG